MCEQIPYRQDYIPAVSGGNSFDPNRLPASPAPARWNTCRGCTGTGTDTCPRTGCTSTWTWAGGTAAAGSFTVNRPLPEINQINQ
jgi:hypothetical protein